MNPNTTYQPTTENIQVVVQIVLNSLPSRHSKRSYARALRDFLTYWRGQGSPIPNKLFLQMYILYMQEHETGQASINNRLAAIRKLAAEAADLGVWPDAVAGAFANVKNISCPGTRTGVWLTEQEAQRLINAPDCSTKLGLRDRAVLSVGIGCGLRRSEFTMLDIAHIQTRERRYVFANMVGKRNKTRTVTIPDWVMQAIKEYLVATGITRGRLFRPMSKSGKILGEEINHYTIQKLVKRYGKKCGFKISPHDLRRTYAKLSYKNGAKLQQIQLNLGHQSLTTTQKYLGSELDYNDSPGDYINISFN